MQLLRIMLRASAVHAVASKHNMKYGARPEAGVVEAVEVVRHGRSRSRRRRSRTVAVAVAAAAAAGRADPARDGCPH